MASTSHGTGMKTPYPLVEPSPWPLVGSIFAFVMAVGAIVWMKALKGEAVLGLPKTSAIFAAGAAKNLPEGAQNFSVASRAADALPPVLFGLADLLGELPEEEGAALIESLEGKRGEPRLKPPFFPAAIGLYGQPTIVNNVETLSNLPWLIANGAAAYTAIGTTTSPGTRMVAVSGHVNRPGVYEIINGTTTFRDLFYGDEFCQGIRNGNELKAFVDREQWPAAFMEVEPLELSSTRRSWQFCTPNPQLAFLRLLASRWPLLTFAADYDTGRTKGLVCWRGGAEQHHQVVYRGGGS